METQKLLRIIQNLLFNAVALLGNALFYGAIIFTLFTLFHYKLLNL